MSQNRSFLLLETDMTREELFDKHHIPPEDREYLARFITTGKSVPNDFIERFEQRPNYQKCSEEALVTMFQPFAEALEKERGKQK